MYAGLDKDDLAWITIPGRDFAVTALPQNASIYVFERVLYLVETATATL